MAPFVVGLGGDDPDEGMQVLDEVFNLDAALDEAAERTGGTT